MSLFYTQLQLLLATFQCRFHHSVHISNTSPALFDLGNWGKYILTSYKGTCSFIKRCSIHVYIWYRRRKINSKDKTPLLAPVPGPLNLRSTDVSTDSFLVIWEHSANDIALYRLSWAPFTGGDTKEVSTKPPSTLVTVKMLLTSGNITMWLD